MQDQKIEFRKERDFSSVLGDSLKFIKQNFKSFFASVILIVGPFILIMAAGYAYFQSTIMSLVYSQPNHPMGIFKNSYFTPFGVIVLFGLLSNILLSAVVYNYLALYNEKAFGEKITVSEVSKRVFSNIGRLILSTLTFVFTLVAIFFILALIVIGLGSMMGIAGGILLGLLIFFGLIIYVPVISYFIPASFYVVVRDGIFIFSGMGKVRRYLSGNFWWTWLIMIVALIALGILQTIFNLPASIMTMMSMFSRVKDMGTGNQSSDVNVLLLVFHTLGMFLTHCTSSIYHVVSAFNFMSHEEKHEGKGLLSRIDEIN